MGSFLLAAAAAISLAMSPAAAQADCSTIVDVAAGTPDLSTLVAAVTAADLVEALSDPDATYTVLAPTNDAFAAVGTVDELTADLDALSEVLLNHVIDGAVMAADLTDGMVVDTLGGSTLTVGVSGDTVTFTAANGGTTATVVTADIEACSSVIHIIDTVLLPGTEEPPMETPETPEMTGTYGDVMGAMYGDEDVAGVYGEDVGGAYGYGSDAEDVASDDAEDRDVERDSGREDVSSASALIVGATIAGVLSAMAGVAVVVARRRQASTVATESVV